MFFKHALVIMLSGLLGLSAAAADMDVSATDLVLADNGMTDYQIVVPDANGHADIDALLRETADLIRRAFAASGADLAVVRESARAADKPGIYIGDTAFARANRVPFDDFNGWSYVHKAVGQDVIIAGHDRLNPAAAAGERTSRGQKIHGARLATLKGVVDFLRRYAGVRFLYPDGEVGIEYLAPPAIAVPMDLDHTVHPRLRFNCARTIGGYGVTSIGDGRDLFLVANNFFPITDMDWKVHSYPRAIPVERYRETKPEYFALIGGRRIVDHPGVERASHYCISNPEVQELIYRDILHWLDQGYDMTVLGQQDGFRACQCDSCHALYDTGDDWTEKLWIMHRSMAERLLQDRPDKKLMLLSYGHTWSPPQTFRQFPENAIILLCRMSDELMEQWGACDTPGGYAGYLYLWGTYGPMGYTPQTTPLQTAKLARRYAELGLQSIYLDGFGSMFGLAGPTYYMFGRIFDDPEQLEAREVMEEYLAGAYREALTPMRRFFDTLYHALQFQVDRPNRYVDVYGRTRPYVDRDPMKLMGFIYAPDVLGDMETQLARAERLAESAKVKARLALVRLEFDYLRHIATVAHLWTAYRTAPAPASRDLLLDAVEAWQAFLEPLYVWDGEAGRWRPGIRRELIPGWPEHRPFLGHSRHAVALTRDRHGAAYANTPLNWDTATMRAAPLPAHPSAGGPAAGTAPADDWGALGEDNPHTRRRLDLYRETFEIPPVWRDLPRILPDEAWGQWLFAEDPADRGEQAGYHLPEFDPTGWEMMPVPCWWSETVAGDYLGYGWYRVTFDVPADWQGRPLTIRFGSVDEQAWVYVNGYKAGAHTAEGMDARSLWDVPFTIELAPENVIYGGTNLLAVRVFASRGRAGIWRPVLITSADE